MHKWELITLLQCSLIYQVYSLKLSSLNFDWMSCFLKGLSNSLKAFKTTGWGLLSKCSLPGALRGTMRAWGGTGAGTHSRKKVTGAAQRQGTQAWVQLPMKQKWLLLNFYKLQAKTVHKHKTVRMVIVLAFVIRCKNVIYAVWLLILWDCFIAELYNKSTLITLFVLDNIFAMCLLI